MKLDALSTCINCENLLRNFICQKHNQSVKITNTCENHTYKRGITKESSCSNCLHFNKISCSKPEEASEGMLCFNWEKNI